MVNIKLHILKYLKKTFKLYKTVFSSKQHSADKFGNTNHPISSSRRPKSNTSEISRCAASSTCPTASLFFVVYIRLQKTGIELLYSALCKNSLDNSGS